MLAIGPVESVVHERLGLVMAEDREVIGVVRGGDLVAGLAEAT